MTSSQHTGIARACAGNNAQFGDAETEPAQSDVRRSGVLGRRGSTAVSQARLPINRIPLEMDTIQYSTVGGNLDRPAGGVQSWSLIQSCLCGLARIALLGNIEIRSSAVGCRQMSSRDGPGLIDAEGCLSRCFVSWLQWWGLWVWSLVPLPLVVS